MNTFIHEIPKAELHLHIEGTLEPEMMFELATKHGIRLPFGSVEEVRRAYNFKDLQSFLDIYYNGAQVLVDEEDFYQLTWAYFSKAAKQNVRHAEIFFDPQTHTQRGVPFATVVSGIQRAMQEARSRLNLTSELILCFLRHLSAEDAMDTLYSALEYKDAIIAVGLDSSERDFPPENFQAVFDVARIKGFRTVAHAGEEGPSSYIWGALNALGVERIDHGVRCVEDPKLVQYLVENEIPLTVCPLSNIRLRVFDRMELHNIKKMLDLGLMVTVNSDDPAYFGGYIEENFHALRHALHLEDSDIYQLSKNAFTASFLEPHEKKRRIEELDAYCSNFGVI